MQRLFVLSLLFLAMTVSATAETVTLTLVASYQKGPGYFSDSSTAPFGLTFDGTNVWYSTWNGVLHQMTTNGVDTGVTVHSPISDTALGWDSAGHFVEGSGSIAYFVNGSGGIDSSVNLTGISGYALIDGIDYDHNQLLFSPDIGNVYIRNADGSVAAGYADPFLGGGGGFSGIERVDVGSNTYFISVNDESSPRQLCIYAANSSEIGCTTLQNSRYEDLAFDGRYLYAADFYGGRIDKIDLGVNGEPIFQPVPEPGTMALLGGGLFGLIGVIRRKIGA